MCQHIDMRTSSYPKPVQTEPLINLHVNISNELTRAAHGLTLPEKRLIVCCLAKFDSINIESGWSINISADEYAEIFTIDKTTAYEQLKSAIENLTNRKVVIIKKSPHGLFKEQWNWTERAGYMQGEGCVEIEFSKEIRPLISKFKNGYTHYRLSYVTTLRSTYSWRLFEMVMQFRTTGLMRISRIDFCHAMEVPETAKTNFAELLRRVITPSINDILEKCHLKIDFRISKKSGKKITGLEFKFERGAAC